MKCLSFFSVLLFSIIMMSSCGGDGDDSSKGSESPETNNAAAGQEVHGTEINPGATYTFSAASPVSAALVP